MPKRLAFVDLVRHPSTTACFAADQYDRDRSAFELVINPSFDGSIALLLELLKVGSVDESRCFPTLRHPAVTDDHASGHVLVLKAEEDSTGHPLLLIRIIPTTSI